MQHPPDKPDGPKDLGRHKESNQDGEDPGFLVMRMKAGDTLAIGSSTVSVREIRGGSVKVAVKATRSTSIRRIP